MGHPIFARLGLCDSPSGGRSYLRMCRECSRLMVGQFRSWDDRARQRSLLSMEGYSLGLCLFPYVSVGLRLQQDIAGLCPVVIRADGSCHICPE